MNDARVLLSFDGDQRSFQPGEILSGAYRLDRVELREVKAAELSILWYTEGKGDEDLAVHFFDRLEVSSALVDLRQSRAFRTQLPRSPLSYAGLIVKIRWCVRVRVFMAHGKDLFAEESFELGSVPAAQETVP